uniref:Secreted protein n=1 Tax=Cacopsylla melanoneura TaxID=428564 RepID=A0A8D8TX91_9HEMI
MFVLFNVDLILLPGLMSVSLTPVVTDSTIPQHYNGLIHSVGIHLAGICRTYPSRLGPGEHCNRNLLTCGLRRSHGNQSYRHRYNPESTWSCIFPQLFRHTQRRLYIWSRLLLSWDRSR